MIAVGLYTFYNVVNALASYPAGVMADRVGKRGLLALGYLLAMIAFAAFLFEPPTIAALAAFFALAGVHGGTQASVEKSLAAEILPKDVRGSGYGVLATVNGIGDLVSSVVVGALWSKRQRECGISLRGGVYAARRDFDFALRGSLPARRRTLERLRATFRSTRLGASRTRCGLALRAKMAAAAGDDGAADFCAAAEAFLAVALIDAMAQLKFSSIALRNRHNPKPTSLSADRFVQHVAHWRDRAGQSRPASSSRRCASG